MSSTKKITAPKETDLFNPIKTLFVKNGYKVQGEVKNCDVVCLKENKITVIELKTNFNLKVLYQAIERSSFSNYVYIGIKRPKNFRKKEVKYMLKILKTMGIGLISVATDSPLKTVDILLQPSFKEINKCSRKKKKILREIENRNLETNLGGSSSKSDNIITAYREKAIYIACALKFLEKASPKQIKQLTNIQECGRILNMNHFDYFKKIERGVYTLSENGTNMLKNKAFKEAVNYYKKKVENLVQDR